jgi:hypothetical protein
VHSQDHHAMSAFCGAALIMFFFTTLFLSIATLGLSCIFFYTQKSPPLRPLARGERACFAFSRVTQRERWD